MKYFPGSDLTSKATRLLRMYPVLYLVPVVLGLVLGYFYIKNSSYNRIQKTLLQSSREIQSTLKYENNQWDTTLYNAHPLTPHPNGSSGSSNPLYIITTEGFIIERNRPINGFLDSSDYKHSLEFSEPETIEMVTREKWRVLAKPIIRNGETFGAIMAAYFNPPLETISQIDRTLLENLREIENRIMVEDGQIMTEYLDVRNSHYNVAFEVVSSFNKMLVNNGRIPTFIDKSYLAHEIAHLGSYRIITDTKTKEPFLVLSSPITGPDGKLAGVIVTASPVGLVSNVLGDYLAVSVGLGLVVGLLTFIYQSLAKPKVTPPARLSFDKENSFIRLNNEKIFIPYASYQYYLCEAVFSSPKRRWERDELLEKFGIENNNKGWRAIYDASLAINKKLSLKLIEHKDKTFRINPSLVGLIRKD